MTLFRMQSDKDLYRRLRTLSCEQLWTQEVPRFDRAAPRERLAQVAVIRAVGVVFAASGTAAQRAEVRGWLTGLLRDPAEKVRRYAMAALPKLGAGMREETELLALLKTTAMDREKKFLGRALDKIGGEATLEVLAEGPGLSLQTEQKVKASVARRQSPSRVRTDRVFSGHVRIHLRCRRGLEAIARLDIEERMGKAGKFRVLAVRPGLVALVPLVPFSLDDLYRFRCFSTVNFVLGTVGAEQGEDPTDALARLIVSPAARLLLATFTEGSLRYRVDYVDQSHQRGAVRQLVNRAYALCPDILNDARSAPWSMDIRATGDGLSVELRPRLSPDPRFHYREDDVAAASHPPLAACMARLAGRAEAEVVWDPFCGSGLELVERALRGGVKGMYGTDISPEAVAIARANVAAAGFGALPAEFVCCDFRDFAKVRGPGPGSVSLVITNPPMGRRVRIRDMRGLFADLFAAAATVLRPGGRLVFVNPLRMEPGDPSLRLQFREVVDMGGFDGRLEMYLKAD